jgi:nitroreductase
MENFIENQNWRYATKKYDNTKKINAKDLEFLLESIRLTASSYGLQPFKIIVVENQSIKEQLLPYSWNQAQIVDASHLIIFAAYTTLTNENVDDYITLMSETRKIELEKLAKFGDFIKSKLVHLPSEEIITWASKQTYLAMGNLLNAAAELKIDATPMEGFIAEEYDKILNLKDQKLTTSVIVPIGYRHQEDSTQHAKKVRKSLKDLIIHL